MSATFPTNYGSAMTKLEIVQIQALNDNYIYLIREPETGAVGAVDPAEAEPVLDRAAELGWKITHIFNTHHHGDHVGGNLAIKQATGCTIVGARADRERIPGIDVEVGDGDTYEFGAAKVQVFDVPGHTSGHNAYWFEDSDALFCGDTLFVLGCGRVFEGTPEQMWASLDKLRALPDQTRIYCAHEYTQSNARFALTGDPGNQDLIDKAKEIDAARARNEPTVPGTMAMERRTNPFLRADAPWVAEAVGMAGADPVTVFTEVRQRKDNF